VKRFHIHVSVGDIAKSVGFYSTLFAQAPSLVEADYAKWMLEDPPLNFAISSHRQPVGVNHLGFQVDSDEELRALQSQLLAADARLVVRPYGTDGVRVSVGAPEENDALLRFARDWITHTESQE